MKSRLGSAVLASLLLALAGPASAIDIYSADIVNGEVKTADLDSNAVTTTKILNGEVKTAVGGGWSRSATGPYNWAAGSLFESQ